MAPIVLSLCLLAAPEVQSAPWLKTPERTFGARHAIEVRDGGLSWKPLGRDGGYEPLPPDGLPGPTGRVAAIKELAADLGADKGFVRPTAIASVSADGDNLLAISTSRRGYYAKLSTARWTDVWGPLGARGPLMFDFAPKAVAMSHRKIPYEDLDGNAHPVTAGVTTVYALSADGRELYYADPWLPPRFDRRICMPLHGTLIGAGLSASASTLFVIDGSGRSFTRLADFDTLGIDPALPYSWKREKREGAAALVRTLPGEDWKEHPRPPGPATARITIVQTGPTNADRELRIEGDGQDWFKKLGDDVWKSRKTGVPAGAPLVDALAETTGPSRSEALAGRAEGKAMKGLALELTDFDPDCSPAKLAVRRADEQLELALHFHDTLVDLKKNVRSLDGALLLPEGGMPKAFLAENLKAVFKGEAFFEVRLEVDKAKVKLRAKGPPKPGAFSAELTRPKPAKPR